MRSVKMLPQDAAAAFVAQQTLAGKDVSVNDVREMLRSMGLQDDAQKVIEKAHTLAASNKEKLEKTIADANPQIIMLLAQENLIDRYKEALHQAIMGGAQQLDPEVGMYIANKINNHERQQVREAHGYTAKEMLAELPISLADGVFAVADYERRKKKADEENSDGDEENAAPDPEEGNDKMPTEEELEDAAADFDEVTYVDPPAEAVAAFNALMDKARFALSAEEAEERIKAKEREEKRQRKEAAKSAEENGDGENNSEPEWEEFNGDPETNEDGKPDLTPDESIPEAQLKRIAPIFESPELFAHFLVAWTSQHVLKEHPELPATKEMWKNPVAVRHLIKTAQHILTKLASDVLGSPSINRQRNLADRKIIHLAEYSTFKAVKAHIASIYKGIHDNALTMSRRQMVRDLRKEIARSAITDGRFNWREEEAKRKTYSETELWARKLHDILGWGEKRLQKEEAELQATIERFMKDNEEFGYDINADTRCQDALKTLYIIKVYGGLKYKMPGEIATARAQIMELLNGKMEAFEAEKKAKAEHNRQLREAVIEAVKLIPEQTELKKRGIVDYADKLLDSLDGNLHQRLQSLLDRCPEGEVKERAREALLQISNIITEAEQTYDVVAGTARKEIYDGMAQCYGTAENGQAHLTDEVSDEHWQILKASNVFTQDKTRRPQYGQVLQLYASILQDDYKENCKKHNRFAQLPAIKDVLSPEDFAFHAWTCEHYLRNRQQLSDALRDVTGMPIPTMNMLYTPVRVKIPREGFVGEVIVWSPIPPALTRRVRHGLDFDESVNLLAQLDESATVRARTCAYSANGIRLRDTVAHKDFMSAIDKHIGRAEMTKIREATEYILLKEQTDGEVDKLLNVLNAGRGLLAFAYLSGNIVSALKQLASMPMWAGLRDVGFRDALKFCASAVTDEGKQAIDEMIVSDGYKARYLMGWSPETRNLFAKPSRTRFNRWTRKGYELGMKPISWADKVGSLIMGQGYYRMRTKALMQKGMTEADAKKRAIIETWSIVEQTQQSGRGSMANKLQRGKLASVGGLIFQFATSPMLQFNFERRAYKAWRAGEEGAGKRFARMLIINHIIIPGLMGVIDVVWKALCNDLPDDDEEKKKFRNRLLTSMLVGQSSFFFLISSIANGVSRFAATGKVTPRDMSMELPIMGLARIGSDGLSVLSSSGAMVAKNLNLSDADWVNDMTIEDIQEDIWKFLEDIAAPVRLGRKAYKGWTAEED